MPQKPLEKSDIRRAVRLVEDMLRAGFSPPQGGGTNRRPQAIEAAGKEAKRRGWTRAAKSNAWIRCRIDQAEERGVPGVDWSIKKRTLKPKRKPKAKTVEPRPRAAETILAGKIERIISIPDVHLCPTLPDVSRMEWMGRYCADVNPDWIVQLGDMLTADSVQGHALPGTLKFEESPRIRADFEIQQRGLERFDRGLGKCRARKHQTKGNHEDRFARFEDRNPQCQGLFVERHDAAMNAAGWGVTEFGKYFEIAGVRFIHIPLNPLGRPYGGKTAPHRIANDAVFSIVHGHTHQYHSVACPKFDGHQVRVISAGCALPEGHIEPYAKHSLTGWRWGILEITVRNGLILDEAWVSMDTLRRRYSSISRSR